MIRILSGSLFRHSNTGAEMSVKKCPSCKKKNCPRAEKSCVEMSMEEKCPCASMSARAKICSGDKMSVPKCLLPKY